MHKISEWFTHNPVAANLLMLLILISGYFTATSIRIEGFPAIPVNSITISTIYAGADSEQVDQSISRLMERALEEAPGVKKISSYSLDGYSSVTVIKETGFDIDRFQNEIKTRIDSISNLPANAERPVIYRDEFTIEALIVQVYGDVNTATLQKTARLVKEQLLSDPKIVKIDVFGLLPYEIRIEADKDKLNAYNLSLYDIAEIINRSSLDYKTGELNSPDGKILIKADKKAINYSDFISIPVLAKQDGTRLLLGDIVTVIDDFKDEDTFARFQGNPSVGMQLYTTKKGHVVDISKAARRIIEEMKSQLPAGIYVEIWGDTAIYMKSRLNLLKTNAIQGLLIIFALLAVFLNLKLAFWVAAGIPISIAGALAIMGERFLDYSLNDITTFGLIIVLGILVDDAIVVGESVFEERGKIKDPIQGTINGVNNVTTATVFGCLTTVAAFFPLLIMDNDLGRIFASFSVVVIAALLVSLVESKIILPAHLAHINMENKPSSNRALKFWKSIQNRASNLLDFINKKIYQPILKMALNYKYSFLIAYIVIAIFGISMLLNGKIKTIFFPEVPGQIIEVKLKMENGSPLGITMENLHKIELAAEEINREVMNRYNLIDPPIAKIMSILESGEDITFYAELQPEENRSIDTMKTVDLWREKVGVLESVNDLIFSGSLDTGGGFAVKLSAADDQILRDAIDEFIVSLSPIDGIHNISEDMNDGTPRIRLQLKPEAQHLGLTNTDLASQIGDAYGGIEVQRVQRGNEEVKVIVKYQKDQRRSMENLLNTEIFISTGEGLPLSLIATIERDFSPGIIKRNNGIRTVNISARLDKEKISASEAFKIIKTSIEPILTSKYPGLKIEGAGEIEEMDEMSGELKKALIIIILLIYSLIAIPLKSYWQPLVIMSVIPFGFVGAIFGHKITGFPISLLSFFGMLAVMGIVVNDSLVMMTRFNELRKEGEPLGKALMQAGGSRFRAIFLTTVTTVCGLLPLIFETSEQAQYLIPAAISLAFGELFATPVTLILVPLIIGIGNDIGDFTKGKSKRMKENT